MKILRAASLGSNITGSYKKKQSVEIFQSHVMEKIFQKPFSSAFAKQGK